MYVKNGICYAGKMEDGIKVADVKPLRGMMMLVTFSTGEKRLFDASLLSGGAFEPLRDEKYSLRLLFSMVLLHGKTVQ